MQTQLLEKPWADASSFPSGLHSNAATCPVRSNNPQVLFSLVSDMTACAVSVFMFSFFPSFFLFFLAQASTQGNGMPHLPESLSEGC